DWPLPGASTRTLYLGDGALSGAPAPGEGHDDLAYLATVGMATPANCMGGRGPGMQPTDQRSDEAYSLVYTTPPLQDDLELIGYPLAVLHVSATAEVAFFSVKLSDVAPDGAATFVSRGVLNATRRDSLRDPRPLVPGQVYELRIELDCCAWVFAAGHRLRLAIAGSDWPNLWPSPLPSTHSVYRGAARPSRLELPVAPPATLPAPVFAPPTELITLAPRESSGGTLTVTENFHEQTVTVQRLGATVRSTLPHDETVLIEHDSAHVTASRTDPARVAAHGASAYTLRTIGGETHVEASASITSDRTAYHVVVTLAITVDGATQTQRRWTRTVPRKML
ncbi:MAG TPA: CocE/NonD family hydrolase, partial [Chloroflexota bacterium]|nr:CocE/NonD family hydrolase [Chloroflexota bacterium]